MDKPKTIDNFKSNYPEFNNCTIYIDTLDDSDLEELIIYTPLYFLTLRQLKLPVKFEGLKIRLHRP